MRKVFIIATWEIKKIFTNWKKALAIFLLPAALMMGALNLFPILINYLTTGAWNSNTIIVINSPESFKEYVEDTDGTTVYKYEFISIDDLSDSKSIKLISEKNKSSLMVGFFVEKNENEFDREIRQYYSDLSEGNKKSQSNAYVEICYNESVPGLEPKAEQFQETVITPYKDYLLDTLGGSYASSGITPFTTNEFNPIGKMLDHRTSANQGASRVIPGIMVLLMYYCTYALVSDIFAAEKERGFYNKLILSPVSRKNILTGKLVAIMGIVSVSAIVTLFMMFISSWLNTSNDAMSLLPFGMWLTPMQVIYILIQIIPAALLMGAITINIVFNTEKIQDTIMCLQYPLILFLFEFFIQMFRWTRPLTLEFFIPLHNTAQFTRDVFMSEEHWWRALITITVNTVLALHIIKKTLRKELSK